MKNAVVILLCYLFGSIPFGLIAGKLVKGIDIRNVGSGNIGATNVLRAVGPIPALIVFLLDVFKGAGAVLLCRYLGMSEYLIVLGGIAALVGHTCSVFLGFKGGKGVATLLGLVIGINPIMAAVALGIWIIVVAITRYVSLGSIIASLTTSIIICFIKLHPIYKIVFLLVSLFVVIKHKDNIKRLINGTENKIGNKVKETEDE
ncbi:MAG: glycerol-3-phosphate 1-O-acyltransferase PlsY [Abditibacteriota bacterium]|nr:glycerol-3-phosphate 1-O-acyltransferase PlsY [Abditibacteriota bacterium]MBP5092608.1 glycerol-3-phosphate 1-O-acyltransferase PlsY [Abditibacteriota bacterium]